MLMNNDINQNRDNKNIQGSQNSQNIQNNNAGQRPPGQNMPGQVRQNPANHPVPSNQNRQVRPQPQRGVPDPSRRRPAPFNPSAPSNPSNPSNLSNISNPSAGVNPGSRQPARNANMANDPPSRNFFDAEHTRTFDTNPDLKRAGNADINKDGTYHYTGRNIKSSRQMFVDTSRPVNDSDDGEPVPGQKAGLRKRGYYDDELTIAPDKEKKKKKRKTEAEEAKRSGGFIMSGIIKVLLYIIGVLLVSIIIAYNIVSIINDVFAFVKDEEIIEVTIPEGADIEKISEILYENDLIKYPKVFSYYMNYKQKDKVWEYEPGTYSVSSALNYDEFIYTFRKKAAARAIVRISIPEGFSIDQIIDEFVKNGIGSREGFVDVINNYDFSSYRFLTPLYETELSPDRRYKLEGYLFPDTYDFYTDEYEVNIITRFLNNFDSKFTEDCYNKCAILDKTYYAKTGRHFTIDDVIALASMVEREAKFLSDFPKISAVFHNRLLYGASFNYLLQSDATKLYDYEEHKSDLTGEDLAVDSPYNTYTRGGLPPSAICNPGYEAITAALWPEENSPNFFFVTDKEGWAHFAATSAGHEQNIRNYRDK